MIRREAPSAAPSQALFADVDNDGDQDLIVGAMNGRNSLFLNDGKGHFTDATAGSGCRPSEPVTARTLAIASAEPQGPVYLTLPREVLSEAQESFEYSPTSRAPKPMATVAGPDAIAEAVKVLAAARRPGRRPGGAVAFSRRDDRDRPPRAQP